MRAIIIFAIVAIGFFAAPIHKAEAVSSSCLPSSLKSRLNQVRKKFGRVTVISAYRKNARIRGSGKRSKHASCSAVDFKVKDKWAAYKWLARNHSGGVGVYSGSCSHIHIDVGGRSRWQKKGC